MCNIHIWLLEEEVEEEEDDYDGDEEPLVSLVVSVPTLKAGVHRFKTPIYVECEESIVKCSAMV